MCPVITLYLSAAAAPRTHRTCDLSPGRRTTAKPIFSWKSSSSSARTWWPRTASGSAARSRRSGAKGVPNGGGRADCAQLSPAFSSFWAHSPADGLHTFTQTCTTCKIPKPRQGKVLRCFRGVFCVLRMWRNWQTRWVQDNSTKHYNKNTTRQRKTRKYSGRMPGTDWLPRFMADC